MKLLNNLFFLLIIAAVGFSSCDKDVDDPETDPLEAYSLIGKSTSGEYTMALYAENDLFAGYNRLYFTIKNGETMLENADLNLLPIMDMGEHKHACPVENPEGHDENAIYEGAVVFQMPSAMGSWELDVEASNLPGDGNHTFNFPIIVQNPEFTRVHVFTSPIDSTKLIVAYNEPTKHEVGDNVLDIAMYKMESMMRFPPAEGYSLAIEPEMPSMGHGSSGNVDPTYTENGHYVGNVNFNMSGDWRIHLDISKDAETVRDGLYFDLFFQ